MEWTQVILILSIAALTVILVLVGFQVFLIFREFRSSVKKLNRVLDDAGSVSGTVARQVTNVGDFITSAKTTFELAKNLVIREGKKEETGHTKPLTVVASENGQTEKRTPSVSSLRRFFRKAGKKLS
ncbi:MAG: hypothetical protein Q7S03_02685 [bacterium]|nr:hypothetical protein [bacterium]